MSVSDTEQTTVAQEGPKKEILMWVTEAMKNASRMNSSRSTGPRTEAGRRASSLSATRHGMASKKIMFMPGEDLARLWDQVARSVKENQVTTC